MKKKKRNKRAESLLQLFLLLGVLVLLNVVGHRLYGRLDLTKEKRFTLAEPTKEILKNTDDIIYFQILLEGEFEPGMQRFIEGIREMLDEFRAYAGSNIQYDFLDPLEGTNLEEKKAITAKLAERGLLPRALIMNADEYSERVIFPGALVSYKGRELAVTLLDEQLNQSSPDQVLQQSNAQLEYKLANVIHKLQQRIKPTVAFLEGHGELEKQEVESVAAALQPFYVMERFDITDNLLIPKRIKCVVVAKPTKPMAESHKYKLDQYIMNGGRVLWLVENLSSSLDSMSRHGGFMALDQALGLDDQLFRYGVRINANMVEDLQCNPIPLVVGTDASGNAQNTKLFGWPFFPVVTDHNKDHPVTRNMDAVRYQFAGSIDTIKTPGIKKTVLSKSSEYSKTTYTPFQVNVNSVRTTPNPERYNKGGQILAVALEGEFTSAFKNRLTPATASMIDTMSQLENKEQSVATKMIVISDGDVIRNDIDFRSNRALPLSAYKYSRQQFSNLDFITNCIDYLIDDSGIMLARSKDVQWRLLDKKKVKEQQGTWQIVNMALPLLLLMVFGFVYNFLRRRRYGY